MWLSNSVVFFVIILAWFYSYFTAETIEIHNNIVKNMEIKQTLKTKNFNAYKKSFGDDTLYCSTKELDDDQSFNMSEDFKETNIRNIVFYQNSDYDNNICSYNPLNVLNHKNNTKIFLTTDEKYNFNVKYTSFNIKIKNKSFKFKNLFSL